MPKDDIVEQDSGDEKAASIAVVPHVEDTSAVPTDEELAQDHSVLKTCGTEEVARESIEILNKALERRHLSLRGKDLQDESFMRVIKAMSIFAKLKRLLPTRTSVLPIEEVDVSGNNLCIFTPHPIQGVPEVSARTLQPLQLVVQFIRVSTDAKIIRMEDCHLQGTTHDKDDKLEQEVIRLVKKFGAGKEARYAKEVSLAGNKFESEFARKVIESAYWERIRHTDKDKLPKLRLDLSRNRIRNPDRVIEELRAGQNAGGSIDVARVEEPDEVKEKALIVVDLRDQVARSLTPMRSTYLPTAKRTGADRPQGGGGAHSPPPRRPSPSPPRRRSPINRGGPAAVVHNRAPSRSRSRGGGGRGGMGRGGGGRSPPSRAGPVRGRSPAGDRGRGRTGGRDYDRGGNRGADDYDYDDYDDYDYSPSPEPQPRHRRRRRGGGGGGGDRRRRRGGGGGGGGGGRRKRVRGSGDRGRKNNRGKAGDDGDYSCDESRSPTPKRRGSAGGGGGARRRRR